ncbi:hypothetical protein [Roseateles sp. DC23W]
MNYVGILLSTLLVLGSSLAVAKGAPLAPEPAATTRTLKLTLSPNPDVRALQLRVAKQALKEMQRRRTPAGDGQVTTDNYYGDCGEFQPDAWACGGDSWTRFEIYSSWDFGGGGGWDGAGGGNVLSTVVIEGNCTVTFTTTWGNSNGGCEEVVGMLGRLLPSSYQHIVTNSLVETITDLGAELYDIPFPLLQKCAKIFPGSTITPDGDKSIGLVFARDAIILAYQGNLSALRLGARVDVKYPSGFVKRFMFGSAVGNNPTPASLPLWPLNDPAPADTPCSTQ